MQKKSAVQFIVPCLLLLSTGFAKSQILTNILGRSFQSLNGKWQVIVDWYDRGVGYGIFRNDSLSDKSSFKEYRFAEPSLNVPGDWNSQWRELKYYEGSVWYRRTVDFHRTEGKRAFLYFAGSNYETDVYLNGEKKGHHEGGFTPFQCEVTENIKEGKNDLVLRVNNQRRTDRLPALSFDWWNYGGLTRDVYLVQTPETLIEDYSIQLKKNSKDRVNGWIRLQGTKKEGKLILEIPEAHIFKRYKTNSNGLALIDLKAHLNLWSPQHPKLYTVIVRTESDMITEKIGFRNIEARGTQLFLNGVPVFLKGISVHEEAQQAERRAVNDVDSRQLLLHAKELGCNFIRLAHYPQNEHMVRLAEELGFMLWEEVPVWQGIQFSNKAVVERAETMLKEMISRDKNRCSVIIWSLSNETAPSIARNKMLKDMAAVCRSLDSTRLVSSAFDRFNYQGNKIIIDDELGAVMDVLAANKYLGWYTKWPDKPGNVIWESNFKKPLIISEFGGEALYGQHGPTDDMSRWSEEYQEQLYKDHVKMFTGIHFLAGVCPWILMDFKTPYRMNLTYQNGWNRKGLLSDQGFKKKAWYVMRDYYKTKK